MKKIIEIENWDNIEEDELKEWLLEKGYLVRDETHSFFIRVPKPFSILVEIIEH